MRILIKLMQMKGFLMNRINCLLQNYSNKNMAFNFICFRKKLPIVINIKFPFTSKAFFKKFLIERYKIGLCKIAI